MSYELYFKSGWSNKDAGLKRSWEIHCHKKATWLAFGTDNYSAQVDIQVQAEAPLRNNTAFDSWNSPSLTVDSTLSISRLYFLLFTWSHSICSALFPLFPCSFCFTNSVDMIRDCHRHAGLVLIDKTISNPSQGPPASVTNTLISETVNMHRIHLSFLNWAAQSQSLSLNFWEEKMEPDESGDFHSVFKWRCSISGFKKHFSWV